MHKLASLRQHLIDSPLGIQDSQLDVYATKGGVRSAAGGSNMDFELSYTAHILITGYKPDHDALVFFVLRWLDGHQPSHTDQPINWEADVLNHRAADIYLEVPLTETVSAEVVPGGVQLHHTDDPTIPAELLPATQWTTKVGDTDLATWLIHQP